MSPTASIAASILVLAIFAVACGTDQNHASQLEIRPFPHALDEDVSGELISGEEAAEFALRALAQSEGISYDEAVWQYGWHHDFRPMLAYIKQNYADALVIAGFRDDRSAMVGFSNAVPPDVQAMLDQFSQTHDIKVLVETYPNFSKEDLSEAIPRIHYALFCVEGVTDATTGARGVVIRSEVESSLDAPSIDDLKRIAQNALESGPHEHMIVTVAERPENHGSQSYPDLPDDVRERVCSEYADTLSASQLQVVPHPKDYPTPPLLLK